MTEGNTNFRQEQGMLSWRNFKSELSLDKADADRYEVILPIEGYLFFAEGQ
jgi:hypothetical protein